MLHDYAQLYRTYSFWDYLVMHAHPNRKIQLVSKNSYNFFYSWVKASSMSREAKIALSLTAHLSTNSLNHKTLMRWSSFTFECVEYWKFSMVERFVKKP